MEKRKREGRGREGEEKISTIMIDQMRKRIMMGILLGRRRESSNETTFNTLRVICYHLIIVYNE